METGSDSAELLAGWLSMLGADFEVHDSPELVAQAAAWPTATHARPAGEGVSITVWSWKFSGGGGGCR